jgi:hypothetical protein
VVNTNATKSAVMAIVHLVNRFATNYWHVKIINAKGNLILIL